MLLPRYQRKGLRSFPNVISCSYVLLEGGNEKETLIIKLVKQKPFADEYKMKKPKKKKKKKNHTTRPPGQLVTKGSKYAITSGGLVV
jgi:hypothetical protein